MHFVAVPIVFTNVLGCMFLKSIVFLIGLNCSFCCFDNSGQVSTLNKVVSFNHRIIGYGMWSHANNFTKKGN